MPLRLPLMPSGFEHTGPGAGAYLSQTLRLPLMPSGFEHARCPLA